ncbi:MAG: glycosyltransferase family 2 protein [Cocleimonas sp.]|nr:glycosyltransferase family 2 protein [Cocleimonas sp.]
MCTKKLSIICVNYKSWAILRKCLQSFKDYPPTISYEIIVVDNDSQDGKFDAFQQEFLDIKLIANTGNHGFSNGCNVGAGHAAGEYLLFLNPDVLLSKSKAIDTMVSYAEQNPKTGITSCRRINPKGKPERELAFLNLWLNTGWMRALYKLWNKKVLEQTFPSDADIWHPDWVSGSVILIQADLFQRIGRWSQEDFWMYSEDPDLCKKVREQGKEIALLRHVEVHHAHGGSSRRNPQTTAITKSEVVTSHHVFIQKYGKGFNRLALHAFTFSNTLIVWSLRTVMSLLVFWTPTFKSSFLTLLAIIKYYTSALIRRTWKSKRLKI